MTTDHLTDEQLDELTNVVEGLTVGGAQPGYPWIEQQVKALIAELRAARAERDRYYAALTRDQRNALEANDE